jgi:hypothetical protein
MRALPIVVAFVTAFSFVESASAHHATAAQYDTAKTVVLKGAISKLEWTNPHVHVYLDVAAANGRRETWSVEFASPGGIIVAGLSKELLKAGTVITIKGYPSKSADQRSACATEVTLADGSTAHFVVGI